MKGIGKILSAIFFALLSLSFVNGSNGNSASYSVARICILIGLILCVWGLVDLHRKSPCKDEETEE